MLFDCLLAISGTLVNACGVTGTLSNNSILDILNSRVDFILVDYLP